MRDLGGKVAVVTGAASGIGRAVAERLVVAGMRVVLADIEAGPLSTAEAELRADGHDVLAVPTDVSDGASVEALRDRALDAFGAVHLVHNNAGVGGGGLAWTLTEADWRWVLGPNLWGVIHGVRVFVPLLVEQGEGHLVNTASIAGLTSPPFMAPYNVSKHAVVALSETLYGDLKVAGSTVGVSVLCPGWVRTRIHESNRNRPDAGAPDPLTEAGQQLLGQFVTSGLDPAVVADAVHDAVVQDRFYILTHPAMTSAVEARVRAIVDGGPPAGNPLM